MQWGCTSTWGWIGWVANWFHMWWFSMFDHSRYRWDWDKHSHLLCCPRSGQKDKRCNCCRSRLNYLGISIDSSGCSRFVHQSRVIHNVCRCRFIPADKKCTGHWQEQRHLDRKLRMCRWSQRVGLDKSNTDWRGQEQRRNDNWDRWCWDWKQMRRQNLRELQRRKCWSES